MGREAAETTAEQKGDWTLVCFLMTDGEPTDRWEGYGRRSPHDGGGEVCVAELPLAR